MDGFDFQHDVDPLEEEPLEGEEADLDMEEWQDWSTVFNEAVPRVLDVQLLHRLQPRGFEVPCVRFSPDGRFLAIGCSGCVLIFDTDSGDKVCELEHTSGRGNGFYFDDLVRSICFFPGGKTLAAAGDDKIIRVWDIESRRVSSTLVGHEAVVCALDLFKDAKVMVSGSADQTVRFWDVESGQQIKVLSLGHAIKTLALSPDGALVAVGTGSNVQILGSSGGGLIEQLGGADGHDEFVHSVAFSPNGEQLASASFDKMVKVWHVGREGVASKCIHTLEGHEDLAICVTWTPDGRFILSGSKDRGIQVWDPKTGEAQLMIHAHGNSVLSVDASPSGRLFATGAGDGSARIWSYSVDDVAAAAAQGPSRDELGDRESSIQRSILKRPGFGLPLNFLPTSNKRFPVLMGDQEGDWKAVTLLTREVCMLKMIEDLTNKPDWWRKARDSEIAAKWKSEAMDMDWAAYRKYGDFTPAMADACLDELRKKADLYEKTGLVPVFDYSACVVKSDSIAPGLFDELKTAVEPLENVPEDRKDWHPGSQGKVLDLVHPSLWPLVYGRTRILTDESINVQDCLTSSGQSQVVPEPDPSQQVLKRGWLAQGDPIPSLSLKFQWLPCDVTVDEDGHVKIDSNINNLHPVEHAGLYDIVSQFVEKSLPAWDIIYRWPRELHVQRLKARRAGTSCTTAEICESVYECNPWNRPVNDNEPARREEEPDEESYEGSARYKLDREWFDATHPMDLPDAVPESQQGDVRIDPSRFFRVGPEDVKTSGFFQGASRFQVIVKLANIHLTPDNPTYDGGSWHIEGQLNEHICATALFYYDNDNITESSLSFRARSNVEELCSGLDYRQSDYLSISRTFAVDAEPGKDSTLQDIGSTLTQQGRAIFFPNLFQHRVQPFSLADASRPGHRKILALFLVDPAIPIISTANVPPQQPNWKGSLSGQHASALGGTASSNEDFIDEAEAKRIREELMAERSVLQNKTTEKLEEAEFSFCEH